MNLASVLRVFTFLVFYEFFKRGIVEWYAEVFHAVGRFPRLDQLMVSELGQLGSQGKIAVHQECLTALLIVILKRQPCITTITPFNFHVPKKMDF